MGNDLPSGQGVDLLLDDEAWKEGDHRDAGRDGLPGVLRVLNTPPRLHHDVKQAIVLQFHIGFKARHALCDLALTAFISSGEHHRVATLLIEHHATFLIGPPKAKGHKPSVQEPRVIRVFDVLHHEFPVAWDSLSVVAKERELSAFENTVYPGHDLWAQIVCERGCLWIKTGKHQAVKDLYAQTVQAVGFEIEIGWHAAVQFIALFHAVFEGQATQVAIELVGPLVVGADKASLVAVRLLHEAHPPVGTPVLHHPDAMIDALL